MKRYELTRREAGRNLSQDPGALAERIAAGEYSRFSQFGVENFDLSTDSGALAEVKSTATTHQSGASGRFRLWRSQHEKLLEADRRGSARYIFVLYDVDGGRPVTARLVSRQPARIGRQIGARGGWNQSGHQMGQQKKLPIDAVFES